MKKLISVLFFLLISCSVFSQSADGRYVSRKTQDGILYFVMPKRLKDVSGLKHFEYDMTMLTWTDSITVNFTFESPSMLVPERIELLYDNQPLVCNSYSPLFIDIKKNHYEVRITSKFHIKDIEKVLKSSDSPRFNITQEGVLRAASYSSGAWKKDAKKLNDIFKLFLYSR